MAVIGGVSILTMRLMAPYGAPMFWPNLGFAAAIPVLEQLGNRTSDGLIATNLMNENAPW